MLLSQFKPRPALVTRANPVLHPRYPVIDAHNHLGEGFGGGWTKRPARDLLDRLDEAGVEMYVDLDGGWGEAIFEEHLRVFKSAAPERFRVFGGVDWSKWPEMGDGFVEYAVARLEAQAARGADGLKIWKPLGLSVRDHQGERVAVDDPRLDPLWQAAGQLKLPVLIHVADPVAFFDPLDETNERWEELQHNPEWHFPSPPFPPFLTIVNSMANMVARHPETTFIAAHVGCYAENLGWVAEQLRRLPNLYVDISARAGELGRQPYAARRFFIEHADRILFGIDAGPDLDEYRQYYRLLETDDEYFPYYTGDHAPQGRWMAYGLYLPDDVLEKVYNRNARKVLER